jgi:hypothetical protein
LPGQGKPSLNNLIDLRSRLDFRPDASTMARNRLASVRSHLGLSCEEFARALSPFIGWTPPPEAIDSWETVSVPPGDVIEAAGLLASEAPGDTGVPGLPSGNVAQLLSERFAGIAGVYATRSEFVRGVPVQDVLDGATDIRASGLSLNLICQQYGDSRLCRLLENGATVRCLFLDPAGPTTAQREQEEGYAPGELSALTAMNIKTLNDRVRRRVPAEAGQRLALATYDEVIRFNIVLVDDRVCIMQPYLPGVRGLDSPTFVITNDSRPDGLYATFTAVFDWLWERGTPWT